MRKALLIALVLSFALSASAFARSLGLPNELVNGSFEEPIEFPWQVAGRTVEQADQEPQDGQFVARSVQGYYSDDLPDGHLYQCFLADTGLYEVDFSGWVKRYVLGDGFALMPDWGWVTVQLTIDNVVVAEQSWAADDTWHYFELTAVAPVDCVKDVHVLWGTAPGVGYKTYDVLLVDGLDLEERLIPEPMSMLVVLGGLAGLAVRRRK